MPLVKSSAILRLHYDEKKRALDVTFVTKRIYRYLFLSGYARLDYRMTEEGQFYLLEANPNPQIAHREDFADSAEHSGVPYDQLLQKIITVGLNYAGKGV